MVDDANEDANDCQIGSRGHGGGDDYCSGCDDDDAL